MTVEVTVQTAEPTPTAVVAATTTWAEFPNVWRPMLDKVWGFLRGGAPEGLCQGGHNIMLYQDADHRCQRHSHASGPPDPQVKSRPRPLPEPSVRAREARQS
jgi:hypothetical protein